MKHLLLGAFLFFGGVQLAKADKTVSVNTAKSSLKWTGKKVSGKHFGTVKFKSGKISVDNNGVLKSADFIVDMTSIDVVDLQGEWKGKLEGHLKDGDFFNVNEHKEARLKLQKVISKKGNTYDVQANLTIKNKTHPVKFKVTVNGKGAVTAKGKLVFDRTKYGIKYGSGSFFKGLGDKMIFDDVELEFDVATK